MLQKEEIKNQRKIEKINKKIALLEKKLNEAEEAYDISLNRSGCQDMAVIFESYINSIKLKLTKEQRIKNSLLNNLSNIEYEKIL